MLQDDLTNDCIEHDRRLCSKKFSNKFDVKTIHTFWEYFIFLPDDLKVHFGFAVYELSELKHVTVRHILP